MSRLLFGYRDPQYLDLRGEGIMRARVAIELASEGSIRERVKARFTTGTYGGMHSEFPLLSIQVNDDFPDLKRIVDQLIDELGLPFAVAQPPGLLDKVHGLIGGRRSLPATTPDAYNWIRTKYVAPGPKLDLGYSGGWAIAKAR